MNLNVKIISIESFNINEKTEWEFIDYVPANISIALELVAHAPIIIEKDSSCELKAHKLFLFNKSWLIVNQNLSRLTKAINILIDKSKYDVIGIQLV